MVGLNGRESRFVELVLAEVPIGQAYTKAGYKAKSRGVADAGASRLLRNVKIASAIKTAQDKALEKIDATAEWVLCRLKVEALTAASDSARVRALDLLGRRHKLWQEDSPLPPGQVEVVVKIVSGKASMNDL